MTPVNSSSVTTTPVELAPNYKIPLVLVGLSLPVFLIQPWIGGIFSIFGLFLMIQTVAIRLQFTETALDVYRSGKVIRQFPYQDWQNWEIFWTKVPILFYFKEVKSIHFLPIIFDAKMLRTCLEKYCSKE
jgi:hypothetical protein